MNWRRGGFRLWICLSVLWVGGVSIVAYRYAARPAPVSAEACFEEQKTQAGSGNPFDCFDSMPDNPGGLTVGDFTAYTAAAVGVPAAVYVVALIGVWVVAGFRKS